MAKRKKRHKTTAEKCKAVYSERNRVLKSMGFDSYALYLKSELWAQIRQRALAVSTECFVCGGKATQVHHLSYNKNVLEGRRMSDLTPLCGGCHRKIEFRIEDNQKLSPKQARSKMRQLATHAEKRSVAAVARYASSKGDRSFPESRSAAEAFDPLNELPRF